MTITPICITCERYRDTPRQTCDAFPYGIPEDILTGKVDHEKENYPNDNGLKYKELKNT